MTIRSRKLHNHETPDNPAGVWMLKRLVEVAATAAE
jgi:hypothetical protein